MKFTNPMPGTVLAKYPAGNIYQFFAENPKLYSQAVPGLQGHNGIDIIPKSGQAGDPLAAVANGKVVTVKNNPDGYGREIRIVTDADEIGKQYEVVYGHCETTAVSLNQRVTRGDLIGTCGNRSPRVTR